MTEESIKEELPEDNKPAAVVESEAIPKMTKEVAIIISLTEEGKINIETDPYDRVSFVLADMEQGKQFGYPVTWPELFGASALIYLKQMLINAQEVTSKSVPEESYGGLKYD